MKTLSFLALLMGLIAALATTPVLFADDDDPGGGSAFDEPGTEEEAAPTEPVPATFAFKDYRIEMSTEDGRWWKHDKTYTENDEKGNVVLKLRFKLPKSESPFDVIINAQGFEHKLSLTYPDGSQVGAANYKVICDKNFERDQEEFQGVKDLLKPKKVAIGKKRWKAYTYAMTGQPSWSGGMPLRKTAYYFKFKDKTYAMSIIMNTTAAKNERITDEVESLLKSLQEKPARRR
jgi:hypothetical protein